MAVIDGNPLGKHRPLQSLGHIFGGQRTAGGRSGRFVVVGLIADVFAVFVHRKRNAEPDELKKAPCGKRRIRQRNIAVHGAAAHERFRHIVNAVLHTARKIELIVGLLIRAGVSRRSHHSALRDDEHVRHTERIERICRIIARGTRTDDRGGGRKMRYFPTADRNIVHKKSFPKRLLLSTSGKISVFQD